MVASEASIEHQGLVSPRSFKYAVGNLHRGAWSGLLETSLLLAPLEQKLFSLVLSLCRPFRFAPCCKTVSLRRVLY